MLFYLSTYALELSPAKLVSLSDADKLNYRQKILDELSEQVVGYLEEDDIASIANFDDSDVEDIEIPLYNYDDEDFDDEYELENAPESYTARDGTIWSTQPPPKRKMLMHNVIKDNSAGPTSKTKDKSAVDTFKLYL